MRAPLISLLISAAGLAAAGCASSPSQEDPPIISADRACSGAASDPLHLTSNKTVAERGDPEIESILTQRSDPRLVWVNRQMYQSLHALDVELRREQRVAACEHSQTLDAQAGAGGAAAGGSQASAPQSNAVALATPDVTTSEAAAAPNAPAKGTPANAMSAAAARSTLIRKSSLSSAAGGGNGATMPKVVAGSDNDIVARRLRKAAEQETDPALREKLWKEYAQYRQEIAAK